MFQDELKVRIDSINQEIEELLPKPRLYEDCLGDPLRYSMRGKGKRLRPLILEETYKMYGGSENDGKYLGIALEMIHNASLVHDDLPALDNDEFRRGIKTTHAEFGESIGILAGDGLLNYAYEVATMGLVESKTKDSYSKALSILANKGGIFGIRGISADGGQPIVGNIVPDGMGEVDGLTVIDGRSVDTSTLELINERLIVIGSHR